jgi:hypothetical protein
MDETIIEFRNYEKSYSSIIISNLKEKYPNCKAAYLPSFSPKKTVDYIFIAMEPSFGWWARTEEIAEDMVNKGFVNFLWSIQDFLFHFAINNFLSEDYYITDISKIAMTTEYANILRKEMYPRWIEHLKKEVDIFGAKNRKILFIGGQVEAWLYDKFNTNEVIGRVIHFSQQATGARKKIAYENHEEYLDFCNENDLSSKRIKEFTYYTLRRYLSNDELINHVFKKINGREDFMTESRKQFIFCYYKVFKQIKCSPLTTKLKNTL